MTMDQLPFTVDTIEMFLLMLTRVLAIVLLLPIFGSYAIPAQVRVGLALLLTVLLFVSMPSAHAAALPVHNSVAMMILCIMKELLIGLAIGFTTVFLFAAVNFAARLIDVEMGFGMVELVDPMSEEQITVMGQLWIVVFTILLLTINGHYFFLLAVRKSFELIPVFGLDFKAGPLAEHFSGMVGELFMLALKMSAPVYVALILTEMALGVVARTVPQINIFFVGLPLKILVGIAATVIVFPMLGLLFKKIFEGLIQDIWSVLYLMA
jgi:flagellar biosynthesis protein FliR